jgi:hypothetical protein
MMALRGHEGREILTCHILSRSGSLTTDLEIEPVCQVERLDELEVRRIREHLATTESRNAQCIAMQCNVE